MSGMPHRFRPIKNVNTFGPLLAVGDDAATEAELARSDLVSVPVFRLVGVGSSSTFVPCQGLALSA